ncbi:C-type natriuretic peptide 1-like [Ambystoma mexicanum]|uniref:C-type natriuretic peptide 1-like n=1 Tax=Ambystoma mexicanum TaxID=8296 RepID=UPI0037E9B725
MRPLTCSAFFLLLLLGQEQARAKPLSSLQSLSRLLDEDFDHPLGSDDMELDREDTLPIGALDPQDSEPQWSRGSRDQPEGLSVNDQAVQKLFSDLMGSSRRYRGRSKKGLYRGCFGVKLDRIGSMSGLGC